MKPIRILQVVNSMGMGGAENFIMNVYRQIDRTKVQFDFAVHVAEPAFFDEEIEELGGKIYHFSKFNGKNLLHYQKEWQNFFKEHHEFTAVHGHIGSSAAIYLKEAKKAGIFSIAHSHNVREENWLNLKNVVWETFSYPTRYVANARFACGVDAGVSRYGKKFNQEDDMNQVVRNGIDTSRFLFSEEKRENIRQQMDVSNETTVFGHVGRFEYQKNHDFLIDIFNEIHRMNPQTELWLIGQGELQEKIKEKVKKLGLEQAVQFLGIQKDVSSYLMGMDVLLMPSLFEGLPVSLIEAQTTGLPCLISTTIDPNVDVTKNVTFEKLDETPETWGKQALEIKNIFSNRKDAVKEVEKAGYSVQQSASFLQDFYLSLKKKED